MWREICTKLYVAAGLMLSAALMLTVGLMLIVASTAYVFKDCSAQDFIYGLNMGLAITVEMCD